MDRDEKRYIADCDVLMCASGGKGVSRMTAAAASSKKTGNRSKGKPFVPGQSGNPSGRPKIPDEFKELAKRYSVPALKKVIEIMQDEKSEPKDALRASEIIMDRAWGKAIQQQEINGDLIIEVTRPRRTEPDG